MIKLCPFCFKTEIIAGTPEFELELLSCSMFNMKLADDKIVPFLFQKKKIIAGMPVVYSISNSPNPYPSF